MSKRILIACEESQAVCIAFRAKGIEAYSCGIQQCSGGHPEWHIQDDVLKVLNENWDAVIAFPPCTDLAVSGAAWFEKKRKSGEQQRSIEFFMEFANCKAKMVAIENPVGIMSKLFRSPDQIIQPYYFGDPFQKTTCLWLKGLPPLYHNADITLFDDKITHTGKGEFVSFVDKKGRVRRMAKWYNDARRAGKDRGKQRSKTFPGIAAAMADQWAPIINEK